jgi:hypothetical protein
MNTILSCLLILGKIYLSSSSSTLIVDNSEVPALAMFVKGMRWDCVIIIIYVNLLKILTYTVYVVITEV